MKKLLQTIVLTLCIAFISHSQNTQSNFINYQGVANDASGNAIANTAINLQIALKFGAETAIASYIENHIPTTDANGLFNIKIGNGTLVSGVYDSSEFGTDASYITVSLNGAVVGTTELNAVPYALSSGDNFWKSTGGGTFIETLNSINGILVRGRISCIGDLVVNSLNLGFDTRLPVIDEFSRDGTFSDNSDTALPTEQAIKTYVDTSIGALNTVSSIDDLSNGKTTSSSIFLGDDAGFTETASNNGNVGIGENSLRLNTSGDRNVALGLQSLNDNTTGRANVALGSFALLNNTTGSRNTAVGVTALGNNPNGSDNVAIGYTAGVNSSGSNKLYIENSNSNDPLIYGEFDNNILRMNGTTEVRSFSSPTTADLILGGTANTTTGDDGIITSDPDYAGSDIFLRSYDAVVMQLDFDDNETGEFDVNNGAGTNIFKLRETGNLTISGSLTQNSDRRLKKDIETLPYGLNEVLQLAPKSYNWKDRVQDHKSLGLIAQEVQTVIAGLVTAKDDEQQTLGVNYIELIPVLINAIKEQQEQIESLQAVHTSKDTAMALILKRLNALEANADKNTPIATYKVAKR